jgi:hypothetical protein
MRDAAQDGMIITMRCALCRRTVHFWAADLLQVLGDHQVHVPPWPCSRCRSIEHMAVSWSVPSAQMLAGLTVRRPVRKIEKWLWRDERT